jgi:hypothetical protein
MSFGVRRIDKTPKIKTTMDATTKVYGRRKASRTIHIIRFSLLSKLKPQVHQARQAFLEIMEERRQVAVQGNEF